MGIAGTVSFVPPLKLGFSSLVNRDELNGPSLPKDAQEELRRGGSDRSRKAASVGGLFW